MKCGLTIWDCSTSFTGCDWIEVRRIRDTTLEMNPVRCVAEKYLAAGNRYAYEQIMLLAVICLARKLDLGDPLVRSIAHRAMTAADSVIQGLTREGKQPMICSGFVFRCFDEARPELDDPYTLEIISQATSRPRQRFSSLRKRLGTAAIGIAASPAVHPDSLLPRLEKYFVAPESIPVASAAPLAAGWHEEMDYVIGRNVAEREGRGLAGAAAQAVPEVGMEDLETTTAQFARSLAEAQPGTDIDGRPSANALATVTLGAHSSIRPVPTS